MQIVHINSANCLHLFCGPTDLEFKRNGTADLASKNTEGRFHCIIHKNFLLISFFQNLN